MLVRCESTGKRVLPSLCSRCSVTNKVALKRAFVSSSISRAPVLVDAAVRSSSGKYCLPSEFQSCAWSGQKFHPEDLGVCSLTGLPINREFLTKEHSRLRPLFELLDDVERSADGKDYPILESAVSRKLHGLKCRIVSGAISPTKNALAVCAETKRMLGLKTNYLGFVFSVENREIIGNVVQGKRSNRGWAEIS